MIVNAAMPKSDNAVMPKTNNTVIPKNNYKIVWEKLPADFVLPDDPVENINQPLLAAALTEALDLAGLITPNMLIASNMGICTKINEKTVIKAPDWFYVSHVFPVAQGVVRRSYTPHTEGDVPAVVMEFLSDTDTGEYSLRPIYPYGKMWFYEQILQIPVYVTFDTDTGVLEVRHLKSGKYEIQAPDAQGRYFIPGINLFLGVWQGTRLEYNTYWLRWWDESGTMLLWGSERIEQERQKAEQERQRAEQERQKAEQERQKAEQERLRAEAAEQQLAQLKERLRQAGITDSELGTGD